MTRANVPGFDKWLRPSHNARLYDRIRNFNRIKEDYYAAGHYIHPFYLLYIERLCKDYFGTSQVPAMDDDYVRAREDLDKARRLRFKRRKERRAKARTNLQNNEAEAEAEAEQLNTDDRQTEAAADASEHSRKHHPAENEFSESRPRKRQRGNEPPHTKESQRHDKPIKDPLDVPIFANPDVAFSESLYDALADSQGAAYWEKVYGQPIHIYPRVRLNLQTGEYEQMEWDDYCAYVQGEMFKKTHAGYIEEQQRRANMVREAAAQGQEKIRKDKEGNQRAEEQARLQREIERSLRRAEERKKAQTQLRMFDNYSKRWEQWDGEQSSIPWPTETGDRLNITERSIRSFFVRGLDLKTIGGSEFAAKLKTQRVRWHPDKVQQRLGGKDMVDKGVMADITLIFQVIDTLWEDTRKAK